MYRWALPKGLARRLARIRDRTGVPVARELPRAVDTARSSAPCLASPRIVASAGGASLSTSSLNVLAVTVEGAETSDVGF